MAKNLSHRDWVLQQFKNEYLETNYRNVLIHSSIIEGVLRNESREKTFDLANKFLLCSMKITSPEFCVFNEVRDIRNSLIHDSFRKGLVQNDIDGLRNKLMERIHGAYRMSKFLNERLFRKYKIGRSSSIQFDQTQGEDK